MLKFAEKRSRQKLSSSHPDSQLDAIGCLTTILPFILLSASANEEQAVRVLGFETIITSFLLIFISGSHGDL